MCIKGRMSILTLEIKLARIDFRLIHGQIVTTWMQQVSADSILIIDDDLSKDKFLAQIYLNAAPPGVKVAVRSKKNAINNFKKQVFKNKKLLILFKSVESAADTILGGVDLDSLQIGGLGAGTNKIRISNDLSLSPEEYNLLKQVADKGVEVYFQVTPRSSRITFEEVTKTMKKEGAI